MNSTFEQKDLEKIIEAAFVYMCACPAQVAREILHLRDLLDYQRNCLNSSDGNQEVHALIASAAEQCKDIMEQTLDRVLDIEGWDRETYRMPPGLRQYRDDMLRS